MDELHVLHYVLLQVCMQTVPGVPAMLHNCQVLQNEMVHFVTNLQHYIMFEVRSLSQFVTAITDSITLTVYMNRFS